MPWDYDVMFTFDQTAYTTQTIGKSGIRDELDQQIPFNQLLLAQSFNFVVKNNIILKNDGSYEMMDLWSLMWMKVVTSILRWIVS